MDYVSEISGMINKLDSIEKQKEINILVSITAFENYTCLLDLILNIKYFFRNFNVYILISLKNNLDIDIKFKNVIVHNITDQKISFWGDIQFFEQHYLAHKYCIDHNINYDYIVLCASNQLFFKDISLDITKQNAISIKDVSIKNINDDIYDKYFTTFINTDHKWIWYNKIKNNEHFMNYMKKNKLYFCSRSHEGLCFDKYTATYIFDEYKNNSILENFNYTKVAFEEIFPMSVLSKYNYIQKSNMCDIYMFTSYKNKSLDDVEAQHNDDNIYSIKPVPRTINHPYREKIRNIIFNYLKQCSI